jgi:para-aminobenzoate synthetase component 1
MCADALADFLSGSAALTGVHVEPLQLPDPFEDVAGRFAELTGTVVLLSGGEQDCSRYHLMGALPWMTIHGTINETTLEAHGAILTVKQPPFAVLRSVLEHYRMPHGQLPQPLAAGLMGYLSYDLKDCLERLPGTSVDDLHLPAMVLYAPSVLVVHDKIDGSTHLMVPQRGEDHSAVDSVLSRFNAIMEAPLPASACVVGGDRGPVSNFSQEEYEVAVGRVIDYIAAGDVYQVNLSQRFQVPFRGEGFELFRRLYARNPAPFFAFVQAGDHQIISTSPERFLQRCGTRVEARPIKGTRPRGKDDAEDRAMRDALAGSAKDDAELSMIVDLLRNDIGKVCAPGSVHVVEHKRLEAYQNVYHLVSLVVGRLDQDKDAVDLVEAAFPGGSITGCPKVRAMEIIDELESVRRHVYCGSIGYFSFHDTMDLSIAIRTAILLNETLLFSVGGGIVMDSDPTAEYQETLHKGRTLTAACTEGTIGAALPVVWFNGRLVPAHTAAVPVTDQGLLYGNGFFETIRVDAGTIPLLCDHLARFIRTWRVLVPSPVPELDWSEIIGQVIAANDLDRQCAAVKIVATRGSRTLPPWDHCLLVSARPYSHRLAGTNGFGLRLGTYPHPRQTPLADHKTLNYLYYLNAAQWALENGFDEALILNPDGSISETNTANLLLINDREVTRPESPAVLSGVMAVAACRVLASWGYTIRSRKVAPDALLSAQQLLATNALMGAVPVSAVDQTARAMDDALWMALNDRLIPQWRS